MYEDFFGLDRSPFELSPDPFFMYSSGSSRNALATISWAVNERKGFAVMTGEVGTGKTLMLRCLFELWEREQIPFAYFIGPRLSTIDFLSYITFELGIEVTEPTKVNLLRALYRFLLNQFENGFTTVLVIDEAHQVSRSVLEEIRLLTNFETAQQKLVQILLVGQPELDKKLDSTEMRALRQRIAIRCHLEPLGKEETSHYIAHRLELAGAGSQAATIFPAETREAIYRHSQGIPRLVNTICDQALLAAYARQVRILPVEIVDEVASTFRLESSRKPQQTESALQNICSGAAPSANEPRVDVVNPNISSDQVQTTASVAPFRDTTTHNYGGTVFPLPEGPGNVGESSEIGECAGSIQEDPRVGLNPETLDESRRTPEEQIAMTGVGSELLDSFEKDFRKAWVETENKTPGTEHQPISVPASASTSVRHVQPAAGASTLVFPQTRETSSAEGETRGECQTGGDQPVVLYLSDALPAKLRDVLGATFESQRKSRSSSTDQKTVPRTWLAAVAALVFLALLFWFGSSHHGELRTFSDPAVLPPALGGAQHGGDIARRPVAQPSPEGSEQSSHARIPLPNASPPSSKTEEKNSTPQLRVVPVEPGKSLPAGDSAAAMPRGSKPPDAISNTSLGIPDAPTPAVEAISPQPAELPVEPAKPAVPAAIPPSAPPMPIKAVTVSRPDFVLEHTLKSHAGWVTGVAFSSDGRRLASGSWDQTVKFWDVPTGQELSAVGGKMKEVQAVAFSRDGHWLAAENSSDTVTVWDATTGQEIHTLPSNKPLGVPGSNWVYSIAFSPDGRWLASGVDDKTVRLWDVATGRMIRDLTGLRRSVMYAAFSPDGRWLASGDDDKNIRIWDAATGQEMRLFSGHKKAIYAVAFSPDGRWLASASADKTVKLWDVAAGREVHTLTGHANIVTSLAFSPNGRWLATGSWDKTIKIWDVQTGLEVQTLVGHDRSIYSIAFDSSGGWLASGSEDGKINLWRSSGSADQTRPR